MWGVDKLKKSCEDMSGVIDRGLVVIYEYRGIDGKVVGEVELSKKICGRV
jgi:hypothetical protein